MKPISFIRPIHRFSTAEPPEWKRAKQIRTLIRSALLVVVAGVGATAYAQQTQAQQAQVGIQPVSDALRPTNAQPAATAGLVVFSQTAQVERETTDADGSKRTTRVPAVKVPPGDEVIYTARIHNNGSQPLTGIRIDTPVPEHTTLVQNSVRGAVAVTYSVDGGMHFAPLASLTIVRDGNNVPATAADVTHLRLQPEQSIPANNSFAVDYRVTVD